VSDISLKSGADLKDKQAFLTEVVNPMVGWLDMYAAARTTDLLDFQVEQAVRGPLVEIGLYYGKYFAVLMRSSLLTGDRLLGLDTFDYVPYEKFQADFREKVQLDHFESQTRPNIRYIKGRSTDYDGPGFLAVTDAAPRFISIDGSHDFEDVYWDLRIADQILGARGIVAADDFLNHACLGVNEAINRVLASTPSLVPFAYICNKLFCCRPAFADWYKDGLEQTIMADIPNHKSDYFKKYAKSVHRKQVETIYFGRKVLTIPL